MPRNASGVYSLPVAAFVSGTVIRSADMNSDLSDIGTALTQSLATTGVSSMTAPLPAFAGTVSAPGYTFAGDTDSGIYQVSANVLGIATNGVNAVTINSDQTVAFSQVSTFINGYTVSGGTVTFNNSTFSFNAGALTGFLDALDLNYVIVITINGGGITPTTGTKGFYEVPCDSTVLRWTIMADQSGSAVVDVNKSTYAGFPPTSSIAGSEKPTLSTAQKNQDTSLTTWTTTLTAGDILGFDLDSVTTCTRIQVSLLCRRVGA